MGLYERNLPDASLLDKYAEVIVQHGLNVQEGQLVYLATEVIHRELLQLISTHAYDRGAKYVAVELSDPRISRKRLEVIADDHLKYIPDWVSSKYGELVEEEAACLRLVGSEYPDIYRGLAPKRVNEPRIAAYRAKKQFYEQGIDKSRIHWTVAAAATPRWAAKVFPELEEEEALRRLWSDVLAFSRVSNDEDHLVRWREHDAVLKERAEWLTQLSIREIQFIGPGTDLRISLSEKAKFLGGADRSSRGVEFEPNIPTEECFTTPDYRGCEGIVSATRPFFVNGTLIEGLSMEFQDGEMSSFSAASGEEVFREYLESDEGAKRVGEVALVGIDSPIFQSGSVYQEILFDENAACHIAIGSAYKFCLDLPSERPLEEFQALGCNESSVHTDIMISSEEVNVDAFTYSGSRVPLLRHGEWVTRSND